MSSYRLVANKGDDQTGTASLFAVATEVKVTECARDVHMECTPFVKD